MQEGMKKKVAHRSSRHLTPIIQDPVSPQKRDSRPLKIGKAGKLGSNFLSQEGALGLNKATVESKGIQISAFITKEYLQAKKRTELKASRFDKFVIPVDSSWYKLWSVLAVLASIFSVIAYGFYSCFLHQLDSQTHFIIVEATLDGFFAFDAFFRFFVAFEVPHENRVEKKFRVTAKHYLRGRFVADLLALIPFVFILKPFFELEYVRLALLVKFWRIVDFGGGVLDEAYARKVQHLLKQWVAKLALKIRGEGSSLQQRALRLQSVWYFVRVRQALIFLLLLTYFLAVFWYLAVDFQHYFHPIDDQHHFFTEDLVMERPWQKMVALIYFIFTTISTVGLGDFHPKSEIEQVLCSLLLLTGLAVTSYMLENLKTIITWRKADTSQEKENELSEWLQLLKRYNHNESLPVKIQANLERYFQHRWNNDRNAMAKRKMAGLNNFPQALVLELYTSFLQACFMTHYKHFFRPVSFKGNKEGLQKNPTANSSQLQLQQEPAIEPLEDDCLGLLKLELLSALEPRLYFKGEVVQRQKDIVREIHFLTNGKARIGYNHQYFMFMRGGAVNNKGFGNSIRSIGSSQVQKKTKEPLFTSLKSKQIIEDQKSMFHFPVTVHPGMPIGFYQVCFDRQSQFLYKFNSDVEESEGFFIRIKQWKAIEQKVAPRILTQLKQRVIHEFVSKIYIPITKYQTNFLKMTAVTNEILGALRNEDQASNVSNRSIQSPLGATPPEVHKSSLRKPLKHNSNSFLSPDGKLGVNPQNQSGINTHSSMRRHSVSTFSNGPFSPLRKPLACRHIPWLIDINDDNMKQDAKDIFKDRERVIELNSASSVASSSVRSRAEPKTPEDILKALLKKVDKQERYIISLLRQNDALRKEKVQLQTKLLTVNDLIRTPSAEMGNTGYSQNDKQAINQSAVDIDDILMRLKSPSQEDAASVSILSAAAESTGGRPPQLIGKKRDSKALSEQKVPSKKKRPEKLEMSETGWSSSRRNSSSNQSGSKSGKKKKPYETIEFKVTPEEVKESDDSEEGRGLPKKRIDITVVNGDKSLKKSDRAQKPDDQKKKKEGKGEQTIERLIDQFEQAIEEEKRTPRRSFKGAKRRK